MRAKLFIATGVGIAVFIGASIPATAALWKASSNGVANVCFQGNGLSAAARQQAERSAEIWNAASTKLNVKYGNCTRRDNIVPISYGTITQAGDKTVTYGRTEWIENASNGQFQQVKITIDARQLTLWKESLVMNRGISPRLADALVNRQTLCHETFHALGGPHDEELESSAVDPDSCTQTTVDSPKVKPGRAALAHLVEIYGGTPKPTAAATNRTSTRAAAGTKSTAEQTRTSTRNRTDDTATDADSSGSTGANASDASSQDLDGWRFLFADDFETDAAQGEFLDTYDNWGAYPKGWKDTSKKGTYDPDQLSVEDGKMLIEMSTKNGGPRTAVPYPMINGSDEDHNQLYGRYEIRLRADAVEGYKTAFLLWPDSEEWPRDGEIDFPEGDVGGGKIGAFMHRQDGKSGSDQDGFSSQADYQNWHTATIEWSPAAVNFLLDGKSIGKSTKRIPNTPMRWVLQTETNLGGKAIPASAEGNVEIDYVKVWAYDKEAEKGTGNMSDTDSNRTGDDDGTDEDLEVIDDQELEVIGGPADDENDDSSSTTRYSDAETDVDADAESDSNPPTKNRRTNSNSDTRTTTNAAPASNDTTTFVMDEMTERQIEKLVDAYRKGLMAGYELAQSNA